MPPTTREAVAPTGHRPSTPSSRRHSDPDRSEDTGSTAQHRDAAGSHTVLLSTGRTVAFDDCTGASAIWDHLEDGNLTFPTPEELARWIGTFYGWRSTIPTHGYSGWDGVEFWIDDAMTMLIRGWPVTYFDLVPGLEEMSSGYHVSLVHLAKEAAGLVSVPVEALAS